MREKIQDGIVTPIHINLKDPLADLLTKALTSITAASQVVSTIWNPRSIREQHRRRNEEECRSMKDD